MSQNKERWLGGIILLSGGALMATLLLQGKGEKAITTNPVPNESPAYQAIVPEDGSMDTTSASNPNTHNSTSTGLQDTSPTPEFKSLPLDIETENKLRAIQQAERDKQVKEQEAKTALFIAQQQQIEAESARMAAEEQARKVAKEKAKLANSGTILPSIATNTQNTSAKDGSTTDQDAKDLAAAKLEADRKHQEEVKREAQKIVDAQAKAQAEKDAMAKQKLDAQKLEAQKLNAKKQADAAAKQRKLAEDKAAQAKKDEAAKLDALIAAKATANKQTASQKTIDTNAVKEANDVVATTKGDKQWMVQVALSPTAAATDALVARLRAKGYKVVTSKTTKGTRVLVGPQKSKEQSAEVNHKIVTDPSLNVSGSWVINWQPLTQ